MPHETSEFVSPRLGAEVISGRAVAWAPAPSTSTLETEPCPISPSVHQTKDASPSGSLSRDPPHQHYQMASAHTLTPSLLVKVWPKNTLIFFPCSFVFSFEAWSLPLVFHWHTVISSSWTHHYLNVCCTLTSFLSTMSPVPASSSLRQFKLTFFSCIYVFFSSM